MGNVSPRKGRFHPPGFGSAEQVPSAPHARHRLHQDRADLDSLHRQGQREPLRLYDPTQEGESIGSAKFRLAMTGLIVLSAFTGCSEEDTPSPPPSVVTVTETASPTPSSTAHPSASTKPKRAHSQAKFDHFMVTVDDLERVNSSEVRCWPRSAFAACRPTLGAREPGLAGIPGQYEHEQR